MRMYFKILAPLAIASLLAACLDSADSTETETVVTSIPITAEVYKNKDALPECNEDLQGTEAYVSKEKMLYVCIDGEWHSTAKTNNSDVYVSSVCKTKSLSDSSGIKIFCNDSLVGVVYNGTKGKTGVAGDKGDKGADGKNGVDGAKGDMGATGDRGATGTVGKDGKDGENGAQGDQGDNCTAVALEDNSGLTIICGSDTVATLQNAEDGLPGADGRDGEQGPRGESCYLTTYYDNLRVYCPDNYGSYDYWDIYNGTDGYDGVDGYNGRNCAAIKLSDGEYEVDCGGYVEGYLRTGSDGSAGFDGNDGRSCAATALDNGQGFRISCEEGPENDLLNGKDGADGKNARNGYICTATALEDGSGYSITCGDGSGASGRVVEKLAWQFLNPNFEYGEFVDTRDGQVYKMTKIGSQVWMSENLNYADSVKTPSLKGRSACYPYNNSQDSCQKYGRHYTWAAAMDSVKTGCGYNKSCSPSYPVQGICPNGWHLPTTTEWNSLIDYIEYDVGSKLRSSFFYSGTDSYGFSAFAAGHWEGGSSFSGDATSYANFWTANAYSNSYAYYKYISDDIGSNDYPKTTGFNIRCIKDDTLFVSASLLLNGKDGVDGKDANDGKNCTATALDDGSGYHITCDGEGAGRTVEKLAWQFLNPNYEYGEFVDSRDGQVYKMSKIGSQVWMSENLNYADSVNTPSLKGGRSECYRNSLDSCEKYGRYYRWSAVMDSVNTGCGTGKICSPEYPVQGICPVGWHVPSKGEYEDLLDYVGASAPALKSIYAWEGATDIYGFSALAGSGGDFYYMGVDANFWTSTQVNRDDMYFLYFVDYKLNAEIWDCCGDYIRPLRCLKNDSLLTNSYDLTNGTDGVDGDDGTACVTVPLDDGSGAEVFCNGESKGVIANGNEGTYCAMVPLEEGVEDYRLVCGIKKGESAPATFFGKLTDTRDGKTYRTIEIGGQTWMAENLNYADSAKTVSLKGRSWCYNNDSAYCKTDGRLYTWAAAMDSATTGCGYDKTCTITEPLRGICPSGWHLPTSSEWNTLMNYAGSSNKLISNRDGGSDMFGLNLFKSGYCDYPYTGFGGYGSSPAYWSATESSTTAAVHRYLTSLSIDKRNAYTVRCVKD